MGTLSGFQKIGRNAGMYLHKWKFGPVQSMPGSNKKWRDKIAQSPATSSPDNFMDILNVIKSVQE